ncbi:hypothetical protein EKI60_06440 [Candidatus Saccharibacteria bacterium]|nr:MAG: hypothetical protein EKI60_06440 [Candidatus Saccharibacteria bacterium]
MSTTKREFSTVDANPSVLYAKQDGDSPQAYPVLMSTTGSLFVTPVPLARANKGVQQTTLTTTASTTVISSASSIYLDVYGCIITNTSATATVVTVKDSAAGGVRYVIAVPAGDTRGFMLPTDAAMLQAAATQNWVAYLTPAVSNVEMTMLYTKNTN